MTEAAEILLERLRGGRRPLYLSELAQGSGLDVVAVQDAVNELYGLGLIVPSSWRAVDGQLERTAGDLPAKPAETGTSSAALELVVADVVPIAAAKRKPSRARPRLKNAGRGRPIE